MTNNGKFTLSSLEVYQLARDLSKIAWSIYNSFEWQVKKIIGDQFIESTDSVGANIAEGYGRYHYLDRIKFLYNARGSLLESNHWVELLNERKLITNTTTLGEYKKIYVRLYPCLNGLIHSIYKNKQITPNNE